MTTKQKHKADCIVTFNGADKWTVKKKLDVANWLRRQAYELEEDGEQYAKRCTCRYMKKFN